jgi:hypothetical protein
MKSFLTKILFIVALIGLTYSAHSAQIVVNATTNGYYLLSTNRASVYSFEITSTYPAVVTLYDCDSIAAPFYGTNYTNAAFTVRTTYPTNYVTSYVGTTGYTNWYTNAGVMTLTTTNAANTNALPSLASFVVAGGTYAVYNVDALFARGICATITTNASMVINYRSAQ